ncbi:MAG: hypothetical protein MRZ79_08755 [Bacteroidia bacterium]|nr:hypothetical protein [Bacteroidia bacterium]
MKLNIIHLSHRTDRWETLQQELKSQNITDYQIWEGIRDSPTRKGISRAHKQIVLDAKNRGLPRVLIEEDDISFSDQGAFNYWTTWKWPEVENAKCTYHPRDRQVTVFVETRTKNH